MRMGRRSPLLVPLRVRDEGYFKYATADGMSYRDRIDAEQLLKSADDLTDGSYWSKSASVVTAAGDGYFEVAATTNGTLASVNQNVFNWAPVWAPNYGAQFSMLAGTVSVATMSLYATAGGNLLPTAVTKISGPGTPAIVGDRMEISGLSATVPTVVFVECPGVDWSTCTALWYYLYPYLVSAGVGTISAGDSVLFGNVQLVLGDQTKPRPTQTDPDDWMLAYRPHNRVTKDGAARYSVTDSEGLVSVGECLDIVDGTASTSYFDTPASGGFIVHSDWTCASAGGHRTYVKYEVGTYAGVRCEGTALKWYEYISGVGTNEVAVATLVDGVTYRFRTEVDIDAGTWKIFVDDALAGRGNLQYKDEIFTTLTEGRILSDDTVHSVVSETLPRRASGIIVAGGKASPEYGDPGIWLTEPDGSAFDVGSSKAPLFSMTTFVESAAARFGLDANTTATPSIGAWFLSGNQLYAVPGSSQTPTAWAAGSELTFIALNRSDDAGQHYFIHDSENSWKRVNVGDNPVSTTDLYPCVSGYEAALYITNFALLDLSSLHEEEFCAVTDSADPVVDNDTFVCPADCHIQFTFTHESTNYVRCYYRMAEAGNQNLSCNNVYVYGSGDAFVRHYTTDSEGNSVLDATQSLGVPDGTEVTIDVVAEGSEVRIYADGVLKVTLEDSTHTTNANGAEVSHTLDTNDCAITFYPYPALGGKLGATDRVVRPQFADTATHTVDLFGVVRGLVYVASAARMNFRQVDAGDNIGLVPKNGGELDFFEYRDPESTLVMFNSTGGDFSDEDDAQVVLDGSSASLYVNGGLLGSNTITKQLTGTGFKVFNGGFTADAIELWPLYVNLFKI